MMQAQELTLCEEKANSMRRFDHHTYIGMNAAQVLLMMSFSVVSRDLILEKEHQLDAEHCPGLLTDTITHTLHGNIS